jgi:S-methylmethionine-dependent homocysteine/selenocysteine methylase
MSLYRDALPQLGEQLCITDGGLETTLVFLDGIELPCFAAYDLLRSEDGIERLRDYYARYAGLAREHGVGLVLETATWRASRDWGERIGDDATALAALNRRSVELLEEIRNEFATERSPIVISGCLGPRGDGYQPSSRMSADEARAYHAEQIGTFAETGVDMVAALTLNECHEAIGIARAAADCDLPVCISFTVETDGRLPTGESLAQAIETVDRATQGAPAYYQINCAHTTHFRDVLGSGGEWLERLQGLRANASRLSHAELDASESLDDGDPAEFGEHYRELLDRLPHLSVLGGCCGTDHRHIEEVCRRCA